MTQAFSSVVERLESRTLMSGNISVKIKNDRAYITGDGQDNAFKLGVGGIENDHFQVIGVDGTTVNGKPSFQVQTYPHNEAPFSSMIINMGGGDDRVDFGEFNSANIPVAIDLGEGNNRLDIASAIPTTGYTSFTDFTAMDIYGGSGDDTVYLSGLSFGRRLRIFTGRGKDHVGMTNIQANRGFDLIDTGGRTRYTLDRVSGLGQNVITTGNIGDYLTIIESHLRSLQARLNGGDDRVNITSTFYDRASPIIGGAGDEIHDQSYVKR